MQPAKSPTESPAKEPGIPTALGEFDPYVKLFLNNYCSVISLQN